MKTRKTVRALVAACVVCVTVSAAVRAEEAAKQPGGTKGAQVRMAKATKQPRQRSVQDIGKEFLNSIAKNELPWQFYKPYADLFYGLKEKAGEAKQKNKEQAGRLDAYAAYYGELGNLVTEMSAQKRVVDEIKLRNSTIPLNQQQEALTKAQASHEQLLMTFVSEFKSPPQGAAAVKTTGTP